MSDVFPSGFEPEPGGPDTGRTLAIILHGWTGSRGDMRDVCCATREALANADGVDLFVPQLPYSSWLSFASPVDITSSLLADIDQICTSVDRYARIFLIGHSVGSVIARRIFLVAAGMNTTLPSEGSLECEQARPWAAQVCRIVTLGGLNRGWPRSGRLGWLESIVGFAVGIIGHGWPGSNKPVMFHARRGAPFIVQTRLQWLALQRNSSKPKPLVVQLLGTEDTLVAPDDSVDFTVDDASNENYFYIELPHTLHGNAKTFSPNHSDPRGCKGARRRELFVAALSRNAAGLGELSINREFLVDTLPPPPDEDVSRVVFVVHGIRDDGYWTRRVAQRIHEAAKRHGQSSDSYRSITSSYGYFPMLPFVLPWIRREKVEWFMDEYVNAVSRYPTATFSYVGHSNGTYMVARALQDYPAARFRNIWFAGSVVRRDYDWLSLIATNRVCRVVNMVATHDWVVAVFPSGLEPLHKFDLGGAGFGGFDQARIPHPNLTEVRYVRGRHGAALVETQWPRIAEFIVNDCVPKPPDPDYVVSQSPLWRAASFLSSEILIVLILLFAVAPFYALLHDVPNLDGLAAARRIAVAICYLILLRFVVIRV